MEIQPGALVQWESQSGGVYKQKRGTVIAFIPSGENAEKYLPSGTIKSHIKFQNRSSIPRVLVKVMTGVNSDIETFYAPEYYGAAGSSANIRFLPLNIVMHIV